MKKYIAPICEKYELLSENTILTMSQIDGEGNGVDLSNERESVGSSIWDQEY